MFTVGAFFPTRIILFGDFSQNLQKKWNRAKKKAFYIIIKPKEDIEGDP